MKIVKNLWASYNLDGNEIWVVKEKFKNLKKDLRVQNKEVFADINKNKSLVMLNIRNLDRIDEDCDIDEQGIVERKGLFATKLTQIYYEQVVMLIQKVRTKWLQ